MWDVNIRVNPHLHGLLMLKSYFSKQHLCHLKLHQWKRARVLAAYYHPRATRRPLRMTTGLHVHAKWLSGQRWGAGGKAGYEFHSSGAALGWLAGGDWFKVQWTRVGLVPPLLWVQELNSCQKQQMLLGNRWDWKPVTFKLIQQQQQQQQQ